MAYGAILGQTGQGMLSNNKLVATVTLRNWNQWNTWIPIFPLPSGDSNSSYGILFQGVNLDPYNVNDGGQYYGISYDEDISLCPNLLRILSNSNTAPRYISLEQGVSNNNFCYKLTLPSGATMTIWNGIINVYKMT